MKIDLGCGINKKKGFTAEQLIDKDGRLVDDLNYEAYIKLKHKHQAENTLGIFYSFQFV